MLPALARPSGGLTCVTGDASVKAVAFDKPAAGELLEPLHDLDR